MATTKLLSFWLKVTFAVPHVFGVCVSNHVFDPDDWRRSFFGHISYGLHGFISSGDKKKYGIGFAKELKKSIDHRYFTSSVH